MWTCRIHPDNSSLCRKTIPLTTTLAKYSWSPSNWEICRWELDYLSGLQRCPGIFTFHLEFRLSGSTSTLYDGIRENQSAYILDGDIRNNLIPDQKIQWAFQFPVERLHRMLFIVAITVVLCERTLLLPHRSNFQSAVERLSPSRQSHILPSSRIPHPGKFSGAKNTEIRNEICLGPNRFTIWMFPVECNTSLYNSRD